MTTDEYEKRSAVLTVTRAVNDILDAYLSLESEEDVRLSELNEIYAKVEELYGSLNVIRER